MRDSDFLNALFGADAPWCHVTDFPYDPGNIPQDRHLIAWKGDYFSRYEFGQDTNRYFTISCFWADDQGVARRRKALYRSTPVIVLDDVREKLPLAEVNKLPAPSWILETSRGSEQWGYILTEPCTDRGRVENLLDGLVANGLAPGGRDPGMRGVTRYVRLPEGVNTKSSKQIDGVPFRCRLLEWSPFSRVTMESLAAPFNVDLDAVRREARVDGAADVGDHPLLQIPDIVTVKEVRSDGRFDITCPWVGEHTGGDDSGTVVFTNEDGSIGYKCHHGNCQDKTGKHLLEHVERESPGFGAGLAAWQTTRTFMDVSEVSFMGECAPVPRTSALDDLLANAANGDSGILRSQMSSDRFVMKDLAIRGQWTVLYAGPNTGKTLLTQWLLREAILTGEIKGEDVFYANCDDTYRGSVEKLEIAEEVGLNVLIPNINSFKPNTLMATMRELANEDQATNKVIVLDTLKKFTDLMDKRLSSQFGAIAREFVSAGGSLICLAHVNKHKNGEGKSVHTGTADIRDDADCVYTIEHAGSTEEFCSTTHTVEFECTKSRGDVADRQAFQYTKEKGAGYRALFDSVMRVSQDVAKTAQEDVQRGNDAAVIEQIRTALAKGQHSKCSLEKLVTGSSRLKIRAVLDHYEGQLWTREQGGNNASIYSLMSQ